MGNDSRNRRFKCAVLSHVRLGWLHVVTALIFLGPAFAQEATSGAPPVSTSPSFGTTVVISGGLRGIVYFVPKNTTVLPDFEGDGVQRVGEVWTDVLNIPPRHWRSGFPGLTGRFEWFAIDYSGRFWIEQPGRYAFALVSDDGSRLFLDDIPVIDNDCAHPPDLRVAAVQLEGGVHRIRVSYFQGPRDCLALVLAIAGPGHQWRVFSTKEFKPPLSPEDWQFPASNPASIVPVTPQEASLTIEHLFQQLNETETDGNVGKRSKADRGCAVVPPVRTCSN